MESTSVSDSPPRFRNERHRAVSNLLFTYNNVVARLQAVLGESSLTLQQYNILRILERYYPDPVCNCKIRSEMLDARSDITRIVDRLIKEDLARRATCSDDRRKVNISITGKGLSLLAGMEKTGREMDKILDCLGDKEIDMLNHLLDKIRSSR